jgi:hypothetical protein
MANGGYSVPWRWNVRYFSVRIQNSPTSRPRCSFHMLCRASMAKTPQINRNRHVNWIQESCLRGMAIPGGAIGARR